jgi:hypothetical protein
MKAESSGVPTRKYPQKLQLGVSKQSILATHLIIWVTKKCRCHVKIRRTHPASNLPSGQNSNHLNWWRPSARRQGLSIAPLTRPRRTVCEPRIKVVWNLCKSTTTQCVTLAWSKRSHLSPGEISRLNLEETSRTSAIATTRSWNQRSKWQPHRTPWPQTIWPAQPKSPSRTFKMLARPVFPTSTTFKNYTTA